ncbi:transglutaminase-like domain-containing protein [Methylocapsa aurea]|uniref:transglutaminase-like domain-containing protein n=1 Tax=Methylocapsa aurea TaxID=663610 RepID=UPI000A553706|nr:transglutaminase domain-containing protein [Methylocapsa aurea]
MIDRRKLLAAGAALSATAATPRFAWAQAAFAPRPEGWRSFDVVTRVELLNAAGPSRAFVPLPGFTAEDWNRPAKVKWTTNAAKAAIASDPAYGARMLVVDWKEGETAPVVEVTSRVAVRDRAVDLAKPRAARLSSAERARYLHATDLIPTDGIVKATSDQIVGGAASDLDKARLIYAWIIENTFRDAKTRGCGSGDIAAMLRSGNLGGKCADINALYVGLARAAGLPARDVYGLRVAPSKFGYKSLGAKSEIVTKAQHCRAEVYLSDFGWVPVDPADVRKVMLEEADGGLPASDPKVIAVREKLFGAWEGNWIAYNAAHDVALPRSAGSKIGFLMYPQAEVGAVRLDCLDPDAFRYTIKSVEVAV